MVQHRLTAWLRPVLTLFALAGVLSLAACGGGGGSPSNAFVPPVVPPTPPTLTVLPASADVYSGVPTVLTITSGTAPFTAFSSNSAILPVTQAAGTTIPLLASAVNADTPVTITVRDASGQSSNIAITVKPSLLLPASITITGNPVCSGSNAQLCSGQDGTATVTVSGVGGASLSGRQVRFDVVLGTYSLIATNSAVPAQTVTVLTDQNGLAAVTIRVPVSAVTQFATIRATDVASGSTVVGQFTIAQYVNGNSVLSVIPTGLTTFTGPDTVTCSTGAIATFYIFGGTPPYTVQTNFPGAVTLAGTPVLTSGGGFSIISNGTCFTNMTFAITDATGRTLLTPPTASNVFGTATPPPVVNPLDVTVLTPTINCSGGGEADIVITQGTPPYFVAVDPATTVTGAVVSPNNGITSGQTVKITGFTATPTTGKVLSLLVGDNGSPSQKQSVTIPCK